jgi:hypothetical protein
MGVCLAVSVFVVQHPVLDEVERNALETIFLPRRQKIAAIAV